MGEKLQRAEDDQKDHLPPLETVKSSIIPQAGETELANGDGDISTIGACEADIAMQCTDIEPGEGRLADCLRYHITQKALGNTSGRVVTHECQKAVLKFMKDQGLNVNKNVRLALACKADADRLCKGASPDGPVLTGTAPRVKVLACLRKKKAQLAPGCAKRVLDAQMAAAEDFHADQELDAACSEDAEKQCSDVEPGRGRIQACLRDRRAAVSWSCQEQLFRQDVENADDMRLSARLFNACANDKARYCADMDYGLSRVKDCLEEHLEDPHFSTACKAEFAKMMESRSMDFRLNTALKQACAEDVTKMCGFEAESLGAVKNVDSRVILCLQDLRDELHSEACQKQVKKTIERAGRDIRLNQPLADACFNDRKTFCQDVAPGSAQVIRCLQESRSELSEDCRATLFDHEVRMAENIDFDYPLRRACAYELKTVCGNAPHGHSLAIRCLEEHQDAEDLSEECRAEVKRHVHDMSEDYRLNARLSQACGIDVEALCAESCSQLLGQACGGTVLRCLQDRYDEISEANCKKEVFYFMQMEVSDFKNDVLMAQACRADVDQHCAEVEPGEGRVFECLKQHWEQLSEECAAEELKLAVLQSKDVRLRPKLTKLCSEEMAVFCKKVPPGKGRVFSCLMQHITEPSFGSGCKEELEKREDRLKTDWRLNAGVHAECEADVDRLCAEEKSQAHSHAEVLLCLVANLPAVQPACASEMSKLVRMAFWDYSPGSYLTRACDEDVAKVCPSKAAEKARQVYGIGTVGHCLSKQLAERKPLAPQCHQLVLVAAPKDIRSFIAASDSAQSMASSFANIQMQALELSHSFVQGTSFITLSGWVAVASIAALFILLLGAAVVFYRRQTGLSLTGHTVYLPTKSGDA